jgi:hypothetical protein
MKIKTKGFLILLLATTASGVIGILLGVVTASFPIAVSLIALLETALGANVLLIILIIATVFTGALFDFLSSDGTAQTSPTYHLRRVSLNSISGIKTVKSQRRTSIS